MNWQEYINNNKSEFCELALKWHLNKDNALYTTPKDSAEIINLIESDKISHLSAKIVFEEFEKHRKTHAKNCYEIILKYFPNVNFNNIENV